MHPAVATHLLTPDQQALVNRNYKLVFFRVKALIRRGTMPWRWEDDAVSEGMLTLLKCAKKYDPGHKSGARFSTYVCEAIDKDLHRWVGRQIRLFDRQAELKRDRSPDAPWHRRSAEWGGFGRVDDRDEAEIAIQALVLIERTAGQFTIKRRTRAKTLIKYLSQGLTAAEIARRLRTTENAVRKRIQRYRRIARMATGRPDGPPDER
jgi:RNA polymerase sigma factor (sigma-70 family)